MESTLLVLSKTRKMHWCEHHLINKGRALTANGNEALIDHTVKLSPPIHKLWPALVLAPPQSGLPVAVLQAWTVKLSVRWGVGEW